MMIDDAFISSLLRLFFWSFITWSNSFIYSRFLTFTCFGLVEAGLLLHSHFSLHTREACEFIFFHLQIHWVPVWNDACVYERI